MTNWIRLDPRSMPTALALVARFHFGTPAYGPKFLVSVARWRAGGAGGGRWLTEIDGRNPLHFTPTHYQPIDLADLKAWASITEAPDEPVLAALVTGEFAIGAPLVMPAWREGGTWFYAADVKCRLPFAPNCFRPLGGPPAADRELVAQGILNLVRDLGFQGDVTIGENGADFVSADGHQRVHVPLPEESIRQDRDAMRTLIVRTATDKFPWLRSEAAVPDGGRPGLIDEMNG